MPYYCTHCSHLGHVVSNYLVLGNNHKKSGNNTFKAMEAHRSNVDDLKNVGDVQNNGLQGVGLEVQTVRDEI